MTALGTVQACDVLSSHLMGETHRGAPRRTLPAAQIQIDTDGAIETPTVRKAIMTTMEGGRDAFELRGRKYAFETGEEKGGASG